MNRKPRKAVGYRTSEEVELEWSLKRRKEAWKITMKKAPNEEAA
jgi:IS30 family transposase